MPLQDEDVKALFSRLDTVVKLLAAMYARDTENKTDAIVKLDKMQLTRDQIADAVGVTNHHVAQALYSVKKTSGKKKAVAAEAAPAEVLTEALAVGESEVQQ